MRRMSFSLTTRQFREQTKTVTRRTRWLNLNAGEHVLGIEKGMGLKKGEKHVVLGEIEIVSVRREAVADITQADVIKEGFPDMTPDEFVEFYCKANRVAPLELCTRIEFRYVERSPS